MPLFEYHALDGKGKKITGLIDAGNLQAARERLKKDGLFVVSMDQASARGKTSSVRDISLPGRVTRSDLASATRQLSTLLKAGLPLVQSLEALIEQMEKPSVRKVLSSVRNRVNEGAPFFEALSEHPAVFEPLFIQMVRAGETGGFLDEIMIRLAETLERETRLRNRVIAAMAYPAIMTVIGFIFLLFLFAYVVPQVVSIFADFGRTLPVLTRILLVLSEIASSYWLHFLVFAVLLLFIYRRASVSERFGQPLDSFRLKLPIFGRILLKVATVRFCHILGALLTSGVPMLKALEIVGEVMGNRVLSSAIQDASDSISRGGSLADSLRASGAFPPLVPRVIGVGEHSGELPAMLGSVAESYEEEVSTSIQTMTAVLEPILILVMAAVVLFVVLAVLLPIFELNQLVRTG